MANWDNSKTEDLIKATLALKSAKEAKRFFRDLFTQQEIIEFGKRWQVAQMLSKRIPYPLIRKETGLSPTTIARVSKWLNRGKGGYKLILQRLHHRNPSSGKGLY